MPSVMRSEPDSTSVPTEASSRPSTIMPSAFRSEPCASTIADDQAEHHQREIFGRAEQQRELGERRREQRDEEGREQPGEQRAERRDRERRPARPCRAIW